MEIIVSILLFVCKFNFIEPFLVLRMCSESRLILFERGNWRRAPQLFHTIRRIYCASCISDESIYMINAENTYVLNIGSIAFG